MAEEQAEYEPISRQDRAYIDKFKTILKSGNDTLIGMVKAAIDEAERQIESTKKTKNMAG